MPQKVQAIVLKSVDKKEKDVSVLLFSLEEGKIWATLRGVKAAQAKLKAASNVFAFGEFVLQETKTAPLVTAFEMIESFSQISQDVQRYFEGCAVLEILDKLEFSSTTERARVLVAALKALKNINAGQVKNLYALNKFLIEIFSLYGFPLYSDRCTCCKMTAFDCLYINYAIGELVCVACRNEVSEKLSRPVYSALKILTNTPEEKLSTLRLAAGSELELLKILVRNFSFRFDVDLKMMGILS